MAAIREDDANWRVWRAILAALAALEGIMANVVMQRRVEEGAREEEVEGGTQCDAAESLIQKVESQRSSRYKMRCNPWNQKGFLVPWRRRRGRPD